MKVISLITLTYILLLTCIATWCAPATSAQIFSEQGFFERFSIVLWIAAGLALLYRHRMTFPRLAWGMALLCFLCGAREADWHKRFTADGMLKLKYYTKTAAPLTEKLPASILAIVFLLLIVYATLLAYRAWRSGLWRQSTAVQLTILGVAMFFLGKTLDRSSSLLDEFFQVKVPSSIGNYIRAYEEGLEMWIPMLFMIAALWPRTVTTPSSPA